MTVQELIARFPEIPRDLHKEPVLAKFAATFGNLLSIAHKPSACSTQYDAGNHYYLKLIGPMDIYRYGLSTREKVLKQLQTFIDAYQADPQGFLAGLLPADTAAREVKGPGCS
ncbi:MAG TPA: hypothetical protein VNM22_21680 [Candidatus Limnocylindrales bacterium]|nr:hypothetical protein [Candidatus Limnocylindrales bacterium]